MVSGAAAKEAYRGQRVLVLGASGFIGRRVAATLSRGGAEVIGVLRPTPGRPQPAGWTALDLSAPGAAAALVAELRPAVTFNLAGYGVSSSQRDATLATRLNAVLPAELAHACAAPGASTWTGLRLVHAGSALEYGTASGDLSESTIATPTALYGTTKLAGTHAVAEACTRGRLAGATARLFTVYGPGEAPGRLLPSLLEVRDSPRHLPLTEGLQRRDFTFVDDVVEGLLRLGALPADGIGTVNLATGVLTEVREFVRRAARQIGVDESLLGFGALPTRPEEMAHDPVNVDRLRHLTGWTPTRSIEEGVAVTLAEWSGVPDRG